MRPFTFSLPAVLALALLALPACSTTPTEQSQRAQLHQEVQTALDAFLRRDETLQRRLDNAHGYVVFPQVGKGGFIAGGGWGRGEVYEQGEMIGYATVTQGSVGLQAGGQTIRELILFQDKEALDRFINGELNFTAQASAVAATTGAAATTDYSKGTMVFVITTGGLMAEAAIGGQNFKFAPIRDAVPTAYGTTPPRGQQQQFQQQRTGDVEQRIQQRRTDLERQRLEQRRQELNRQMQQLQQREQQQQQRELQRLEEQQRQLEQRARQLEQEREQIEQNQQQQGQQQDQQQGQQQQWQNQQQNQQDQPGQQPQQDAGQR